MPATAALEQLSLALDQASTPIERIRPEQSNAPTPCSGFDLRPVVNHMVYDLQSFASMLKSAPRGSPDIDLIDGDWIAAYRSAAANPLATWHQRGTEEPLKLQMGEMPAAWGVGQHLADMAVHARDVARATGQPTDKLDPDLAEIALSWARENLRPQFRGQAFGSEVPIPQSAPIYNRPAGFFWPRSWLTRSPNLQVMPNL